MRRDEAKSAGLKRYIAEKPCQRDHAPIRYVSDGSCCECRVISHNARRVLPDYRAYQQDWWANHREWDRGRSKSETYRAMSRKRAANRRSIRRVTSDVSSEERHSISEHYKACDLLRNLGFDVELDHIFPLSKGGPERLWNIEIVPRWYNRQKRDDISPALRRFEVVT